MLLKDLPDQPFPIPTHATWGMLDSTKLQTYMRCPRQYFFEYILGWRRKSGYNDLAWGNAMHCALEYLMVNGVRLENVQPAYDNHFLPAYRREFGAETDEFFIPKTPLNALRALIEYVEHYRVVDSENLTLMTEVGGSVTINSLGDGLHFRIDAIVANSAGKVFVLEHKTKGGAFNWQWEASFTLSPQVGTYTHVLYSFYPQDSVKGVVINGISITKTKVKPPTIAFKRVPCWRTPRFMQQWLNTTNSWVEGIKRDFEVLSGESEGDLVMNSFRQNPTACTGFRGCPYLTECTTWNNPLQHYEYPPEEFDVRWWDPLEIESRPLKTVIGGQHG